MLTWALALGRYKLGTAKWRLIHWYFCSTSKVLKHLLFSLFLLFAVFYATEVFRSTDPTWLTQTRNYQTTSKPNLLNWIKSLPFFVYWETFQCNSCWLTVTLALTKCLPVFKGKKKDKCTSTWSSFWCSRQGGKERYLAMLNTRALPPNISRRKAFPCGWASAPQQTPNRRVPRVPLRATAQCNPTQTHRATLRSMMDALLNNLSPRKDFLPVFGGYAIKGVWSDLF